MNARINGPVDGNMEGTQTQVAAPIMGISQEEFEKLAASIMIAIPHRPSEGVTAGLLSAAQMWSRFATPTATVQDQFGGFVEITRAGMARMFLDYCKVRPHVKYLVMIDSDQEVGWDAPYRLAYWGAPIVSGVVCSIGGGGNIQACFTLKDDYGNPRFPSTVFTRTMPGRGLLPVHSCGTGLICIRRDVLEAMAAADITPFLVPDVDRQKAAASGVMKYGEDIAFCRQAEALGFARFVDLSVHASHFKTLPIMWPEGQIDFEMDPATWKVDMRDYCHEA